MKKIFYCLIFIFMSLLLVFTTSCNSGKNDEPDKEVKEEYTIHFTSDDVNLKLADLKFTEVSEVTLPTPVVEGYQFSHWFYKLGGQIITINNTNLPDIIKFGKELTFYGAFNATYLHYDINASITLNKGEEESKKDFNVELLSPNRDENMDIIFKSENSNAYLYSRENKIYFAYKVDDAEFKYVVPFNLNGYVDFSNLDVIPADSSDNLVIVALTTMLNYKQTDKGFSISVDAKGIRNLLGVIDNQITNPKVHDFVINLIRQVVNENTKNLLEKYKQYFNDFDFDTIINATDEELTNNIKDILSMLSDVVKKSNISLKLEVDNSTNTKVSYAKLTISLTDFINTIDYKLQANLTINKKEMKGLTKLVDSDYTNKEIDELINMIKELFK